MRSNTKKLVIKINNFIYGGIEFGTQNGSQKGSQNRGDEKLRNHRDYRLNAPS